MALTREQSREGAHRSTDVWRLDRLLRLVPWVDVDESVSEGAGALGRRYLRSHPGIEEAEGTRALVLELVEGPTLPDRISKGPIPLDEALPMAKQIAEALEAAHEAVVVHRDLNGVYRSYAVPARDDARSVHCACPRFGVQSWGDSTVREVVLPMTLDGKAAQESRILNVTNAALLLLAVILLIVGFPFFLFGLFLAVSQGPDGIGKDVASGFSFGGLVSVSCALVIKGYLRRRDGWF